MKPSTVNILGIPYEIKYEKRPSDVDILKRTSLWGHIDYWTRIIRVFDDGSRTEEDTFHTIIHEVLHGISSSLNLVLNNSEHHDDLDVLALALTDVLFRNDWIKKGDSS